MSVIGKIDCGELAMIQGQMDSLWTDSIARKDYEADAEAAKAIMENQTVNFTELTGRKDRVLSVEWQQKCGITTQSCSDDCNIGGSDVTPICKEYEIMCLQETEFKVSERVYRTRTIDEQEAIAKNILLHMKAMDEWLAKYIVTGLLAYSGENKFTGGIGTVAGDTTSIAAANWDDNIWGYLNRVIRGNKFKNPFVITGDNLFQLLFNRYYERADADGKGNFAKIGTIGKIYQDPENIEAVAQKTTFLVNHGSVAFLNKPWNPVGIVNAELKAGQYLLWSEKSRNIPDLYYDMIRKDTCSGNDFHKAFKIQLHGNFVLNPQPCDDGITGALKFLCV